MSQDDDAIERVARALRLAHGATRHQPGGDQHWDVIDEIYREAHRREARAAITAYLSAMPPPVSPELIAGLNKLATYLTEQGEYEAVDLIDTVVARVIDVAPPAALAGSGEK